MISFEQFITEKWVSDLRKRDIAYPIYENPSSKDLVDLKKTNLRGDMVRFIALFEKKKIYVFSGMNIIHDDAYNQLVSKKVISRTNINNINQAFCGECKLIEGRLSFAQNTGIDSYFGGLIASIKKNQMDNLDSFLPEPYYDIDDFIKDLPSIIEKYKWVSKFIDDYDTKSSPAILLQIYKK